LKIKLKAFLLLIGLFCVVQTSFGRAVVSGIVIDALTKKPIAGASISVSPGNRGTKTDENGKYIIVLPFGDYYFVFSGVGFYKKTRFVKVADDITLDIDLNEEVKIIDEVTIKGRKDDANVKSAEMGSIKLNMSALRKIPVVFGETDILKALTIQPGITTVGEGAGGINVRGGKVDQNLVTLDGAPLFNTSHLLGFFTSVNADIINDVTLYKGVVPASAGGRLSAILAMNTKTGNDEKMRYSVGVGTISSKIVAEGPIIKNKLNMALAGRIAYPNLAIRQFPEPTNKSAAFFYDGNLKLNYKINNNNRVSLSTYHSYDDFKFPDDTAYRWTSTLASLQWNKVVSKKLSASTSLIYSNYYFDVLGLKPQLEFAVKSKIDHKEAKSSFFYDINEKIKAEFGANVIMYQASPSEQYPTAAASNVIVELLPKEYGREMASFASIDWVLNKVFSLQAGLRYSFYQNIGPRNLRIYTSGAPLLPENQIDSTNYTAGKVLAQYGGIEPRLSIKMGLGPYSSIKIGYNRMRQYLNLISNTSAISPIDYWKLSDPYLPPQVSDQYSLGLFKNLSDNTYEIALETYYKVLTNLVDYKKGARLSKNPFLETALLSANGYGYGAEASIRKNKGDLTGMFSYTYARVLQKIKTAFKQEEVNNGEYFPANFDRPHNLNISTIYTMRYGFSFSGNFNYVTGRPATYPDGAYSFNGLPVINYSKRNLDRIPDYHRLDLSLSLDTRRNKEQLKYSIWNLSLYNAYGRRNPYSVYFTSYNLVTRPYRLSVFGQMIPSLTWSKFF
jgi:hypothetical protein